MSDLPTEAFNQAVAKYLNRAVERNQGSLTLFLWEQVTPSVRAGRRYPATREADGSITAKPTAPQDIEGATIETVNEHGKRLSLWDLAVEKPVSAGDTVRVEVRP